MLAGLLVGAGIAGAQEQIHYRWHTPLYAELDGKEALLYGGSLPYGKLTFGDLDGDGDPELLLGKADGGIALFTNRGRPGEPRWRLTREQIAGLHGESEGQGSEPTMRAINVGSYSAPALVDIDGDGDLDLFIGGSDNRLWFYRNVGNRHLPTFALETDRFVSGRMGRHLVPVFADVDGDRAPDLVIGNASGDIHVLMNQGDQKRAEFCVEFPRPDALPEEPPPCRPPPWRVTREAPDTHAVPAFADWDNDGDLDLFVGKSNGTIAYYENRGSRFAPDWVRVQARFLAIDSGGFAAPAFIDVNRDGEPDLLVGSSTNAVTLYTGRERVNVLDIYRVKSNYLDVQRFGGGLPRIVATSGDLDGDGDPDLILGDRAGRLMWFENVGSAEAAAWRLVDENLLPDATRQNAAPHLSDLDGDGDLDLLVGDRDGTLTFVRNQGTPEAPDWAVESTRFAGIDVGSGAVPTTLDADGDGDPDLVVGNGRGLLILYRNEGDAERAEFTLTTTRFADVQVDGSAAPAVFDWNDDGNPDVAVGARDGRVVLSINRATEEDDLPARWEPRPREWSRIRVPEYATPHFADFNGDGRADLVLGDAEGNVRLYYNQGFRRIGQTAQAAEGGAAAEGGGATAASEAGRAPGPLPEMESALDAGLSAPEPAPAAPPPPPTAALSESTLADLEDDAALEQTMAESAMPTGPVVPLYTPDPAPFADLEFAGKTVPAFADLDGDGDVDLVVGVADGTLAHFRNDGTAAEPKWTRVTGTFADYDGTRHPAPVFADLDGDGTLDLLVGTEPGRVLFYQGTSRQGGVSFSRVPDPVPAGSVGRNSVPAVGDLDGDGAADLLVGNFSGRLVAFRQIRGDAATFELSNRRFLGVDVGIASAPFLGDIDRDERPDLLVGSDSGSVTLYSKGGGSGENGAGWAPGERYLQDLKIPAGSTPRLVDLDSDGDADLVLGTESGRLVLFRNDANPQSAAAVQ